MPVPREPGASSERQEAPAAQGRGLWALGKPCAGCQAANGRAGPCPCMHRCPSAGGHTPRLLPFPAQPRQGPCCTAGVRSGGRKHPSPRTEGEEQAKWAQGRCPAGQRAGARGPWSGGIEELEELSRPQAPLSGRHCRKRLVSIVQQPESC